MLASLNSIFTKSINRCHSLIPPVYVHLRRRDRLRVTTIHRPDLDEASLPASNPRCHGSITCTQWVQCCTGCTQAARERLLQSPNILWTFKDVIDNVLKERLVVRRRAQDREPTNRTGSWVTVWTRRSWTPRLASSSAAFPSVLFTSPKDPDPPTISSYSQPSRVTLPRWENNNKIVLNKQEENPWSLLTWTQVYQR